MRDHRPLLQIDDELTDSEQIEQQRLASFPQPFSENQSSSWLLGGKTGFIGQMWKRWTTAPENQQEHELSMTENDDGDEENMNASNIMLWFRSEPSPVQLNGGPGRGRRKKLGAVEGVLVPVWLSMWGILGFVRLAYCVGQAGVFNTILMFIIGFFIALVTTLSISAIGSNGQVRGGGPYFVISRTIGVEFGGCIGIIFVLGNIFGNAMNIFGFLELLMSDFSGPNASVANVLPSGSGWQFLFGSLLLSLCAGICFLGAKLFAKTSTALFLIMSICTVLVFISFLFRSPFSIPEASVEYTSWNMTTFSNNLYSNYTASPVAPYSVESFSSIFGILYPSCTGILAGASMSGDLKDPRSAIPFGTLAAMGVAFVSYIMLSLFIGATITRETLVKTFTVLNLVTVPAAAVQIAIYSSAIFAVVGGIITTAKVLQAMARDDIIPLFKSLARGNGNDEPVLAILVIWFSTQLLLLVGQLNLIVPFITMLALVTYGIINLACFLLKTASAPNFRPSFIYFHWSSALVGFIGCVVCMYLVSGIHASLSIVFLIVLWMSIHFVSPPKAWGEIQQALIYHQVRKYLLRLDTRKDHVKYWRPQILLLLFEKNSTDALIEFSNALKKGSLYIIGDVIIDNENFKSALNRRIHRNNDLQEMVDVLKVKAFVETTIDSNYRNGTRSMLMSCGLGGMKPNILLLPFIAETNYNYVGIIEDAVEMNKSIAIARGFLKEMDMGEARKFNLSDLLQLNSVFGRQQKGPFKFIDIYPLMIHDNISSYTLILQLGCILHTVPAWSEPNFCLRIISIVEYDSSMDYERKKLSSFLSNLRIKARIVVVSLQSVGISCKNDDTQLQRRSKGLITLPSIIEGVNLKCYFEKLDAMSQLDIINRIYSIHSHPHQTSVIFTCLPMPNDLSEQPLNDAQYLEYLNVFSKGSGEIETNSLTAGLPPIVMVYGQGIVVTNSL